ncbi:MAG TPA: clostripain-related cysteine peptidase [Blastocatellia bacterium]|nr:clostripain-related cysteine peptidase [Blastocatellia bacterium]
MNEWTIMYYFAGDNELAPVLVSQLKAITDAGFQEDTDVLIYFDPNELGVPTRIYDVNRKRKRESGSRTRIGDGDDPFVRTLDGDDIEEGAPGSMDETKAELALEKFLDICSTSHPAKRYMLFLIGHGMVVGNDAFLSDRNPISAITLKRLGEIVSGFTDKIKPEGGTLELLGLHSCSMSAIEVAYQLKGTANYMMASEGPSFTGSWPYRQLLKKIFKNLEKAKEKAQQEGASEPSIDVLDLVKRLFGLTFHNAKDFLLAGYSHDLALCRLDRDNFEPVTAAIKTLVAELIAGLNASNSSGKRITELVLLSHWEAQSFWGECYTDLHDFCHCLSERCKEDGLEDLSKACEGVIAELKKIVIRSRHLGSDVQFSHGLSIYFPWSRPVEDELLRKKATRPEANRKYDDEEKGILEKYREYAFTIDFKDETKTWLSFLETYFKKTMRLSRKVSDDNANDDLIFESSVRNPAAGSRSIHISSLPGPGKVDSQHGAGCTCPSIKNYERIPQVKEPGS